MGKNVGKTGYAAPRGCSWKFVEDCECSGHYETDCLNTFAFADGGDLTDQGFEFCPFCGRPIIEMD